MTRFYCPLGRNRRGKGGGGGAISSFCSVFLSSADFLRRQRRKRKNKTTTLVSQTVFPGTPPLLLRPSKPKREGESPLFLPMKKKGGKTNFAQRRNSKRKKKVSFVPNSSGERGEKLFGFEDNIRTDYSLRREPSSFFSAICCNKKSLALLQIE